MGKLTDKVARGVFWVLLEKFGIQAAHFVVTLVLARLLTPDDYGTVALLSVFITLSNLLVDSGFAKALVQRKNATQTDYNSVFYLSMAIAVVLYVVLFFAAPFVARFYGVPELKIMLRILALSLIFHSINGVQNVELNRKMLFKLSFRVSWAKVIVSSVTGVVLAIAGYGPWALVFSSLAGGVIGVVARQLVIKWRPSLTFSWKSIGELYGFGWRIAASSFLTRGYNELYGLLIGKFYARADLAFVRKGAHVPRVVRGLAEGTLARVSFPALSRLQDDPRRLCRAMRKMIRCSTFMVMPMMTILAVVAEPLVFALFGSRWLPAVPYLRIACIGGAAAPFISINTQALIARGRSDIFFRIMVVYRILGLVIMATSLSFGVMVFYLANVFFTSVFGIAVWAAPNRRYLGYSMAQQLGDLWPSVFLSAVAGFVSMAVLAIPSACGMGTVQFRACVFVPGAAMGLAAYISIAFAMRCRPLGEMALAVLPMARKKSVIGLRVIEKVVERCGAGRGGARR